jgi:hypothetical protein
MIWRRIVRLWLIGTVIWFGFVWYADGSVKADTWRMWWHGVGNRCGYPNCGGEINDFLLLALVPPIVVYVFLRAVRWALFGKINPQPMFGPSSDVIDWRLRRDRSDHHPDR